MARRPLLGRVRVAARVAARRRRRSRRAQPLAQAQARPRCHRPRRRAQAQASGCPPAPGSPCAWPPAPAHQARPSAGARMRMRSPARSQQARPQQGRPLGRRGLACCQLVLCWAQVSCFRKPRPWARAHASASSSWALLQRLSMMKPLKVQPRKPGQ
jgi:hypothetical protein